MKSETPNTAIAVTHPARLRAHAARYGFGSPALEPGFCYLEWGAGIGANLLPLAARFPEATFVGIEPDAAKRGALDNAVNRCGLSNAVIRADGTDVGETFDFVVAHGIYSWTDHDGQEELLAACAAAIGAQGVALVSYNCLPGWALRGALRDMMRRATLGSTDEDRILAARSTAARLRRHLGEPSHAYRALLAAELELIAAKTDGELLDDDLAPQMEAIDVATFVERAARHDLQLVAEMMPATPDGALDAELAPALANEGLSRVAIEQDLDMLSNRQIRASLLCAKASPIRALPEDRALAGEGFYCARLAPMADEPLVGPGHTLAFRSPTGAVIEAEQPLLKAALLTLGEQWPRSLTARELITQAREQLEMRGFNGQASDDETIKDTVADLHALSQRRLVELLGWRPTPMADVPAEPKAHAVTQLEAERSSFVTTSRHEPVELDPLTRAVVRLLDGSRDREALATAILQRIDGGMLELPLPDGRRRDAVGIAVLNAVVVIRNLGLLVP